MKSRITALVFILSFLSLDSLAQTAFGVSPGLNLNGAYVGLRKENNVFFFSFQHLGLRHHDQSKRTGYTDYNSYQYETISDDIVTKAHLYIPSIGLKHFFAEKGQIQSYYLISVSKPFITGKVEDKNAETEDDIIGDEIEKLSIWGASIGIGAEYFFDDNFSIGGEYGLMGVIFRYKEKYDEPSNDQSYYAYSSALDDQYTFNPTYSKISLNYYF